MTRIVHAGDIHLDSPLRGLSRLGDEGLASELRLATRRAFDNLVRICIAERAELLVVAGDVYDGDWHAYSTGEYFVRQLRNLRESGVEVVMVWGNHDAESTITRRLTMPDGVKVLSTDAPETVEFPDLGVVVHGQGYAIRDVTKNLAQDYPKRRDGWLNIGVLHTAVAGADGHEPYAPCSVDDLVRCEYDYFALGHVHQRRELSSGSATVGFSGNLQGRHSRETGSKGALVIDLESGAPARVHFVECDVARWEVLAPDISDCRGIGDVIGCMRQAYDQALGSSAGLPIVVRFYLSGPTPAARELIRDAVRLDAEARAMIRGAGAVEKVVVEVSAPYSAPTLDHELQAMIGDAAEGLAGDSERVKEILKDLKKKGIWRQLYKSECDLDDSAVLERLVRCAAKELTAASGREG